MEISHTFNLSEKSKNYQSEEFHSLNIVAVAGKKKIEIPSRISEHLSLYKSNLERITNSKKEIYNLICSGYFSKSMLDEFLLHKIFPIYHLLEDERLVIAKISEIKKYQQGFSLTSGQLEKDYSLYAQEISDVFDKHVKRAYLSELRELFSVAAEKENEKELFRLSDFLIHFINWGNTFYNYYETCFDIIPGHLRKVENHLSNPLRTKIKAYMAYHSHINTLKRLLEKREQGRISTLSVLDWKTDIQQLLLKQFNSVFGSRKSNEYIKSLDGIVNLVLEQ